jgi:hypothetical protein
MSFTMIESTPSTPNFYKFWQANFENRRIEKMAGLAIIILKEWDGDSDFLDNNNYHDIDDSLCSG